MNNSAMKSVPMWGDKPYYTINEYCKQVYHEKFYKIALDAGFTCPNRDGTLDFRGCVFCSAGGSGEFAVKTKQKSVSEQIQEGLQLFKGKKTGSRFIAYFQAFTNTYAPVSRLRTLYTQALCHPSIAGISIATRPDCISNDCLALLCELSQQFPDKFLWIELGLQTMHEATAQFIRRGYPLSVFEDTMKRLTHCRIPVIVHVILGLPKETFAMQYQTISYLNQWQPFGIKLQLMHILEGTDLADYYLDPSHNFSALSKDAYISLLIGCIERLSPEIVIHRVTGDAPKDLLIAPLFSRNKRDVLNTLHMQMKKTAAYQGRLYSL